MSVTIILILLIFDYLIADIPHNLTLLTSATQGGTHNSRHAGQRYIQKGTEGLSGNRQATNDAQRLINRT